MKKLINIIFLLGMNVNAIFCLTNTNYMHIPIRIEKNENMFLSPFILKVNNTDINENITLFCTKPDLIRTDFCKVLEHIRSSNVGEIMKYLDPNSVSKDKSEVAEGVKIFCTAISNHIDDNLFVKKMYELSDQFYYWELVSSNNRFLPLITRYADDNTMYFHFHYNHPLYYLMNTVGNGDVRMDLNIIESATEDLPVTISIPFMNSSREDVNPDIQNCLDYIDSYSKSEEFNKFHIFYDNLYSIIKNNQIEDNQKLFGNNTINYFKNLPNNDTSVLLREFPSKFQFLVTNTNVIFAFYKIGNIDREGPIYNYYTFYKINNADYQFVNYRYTQGIDQVLRMRVFEEQLYEFIENSERLE